MTSATPVENSSTSIPVPGYVRDLLLRVVAGWSPDAMELGSIESLRLNGVDFSDLAPHIALDGDRLVATLRGVQTHRRLRELLPFPMGAAVEGKLEAGVTFSGADILRVSLGADLRIEMSTWSVLNTAEPSLWIGRLDGSLSVDFGGNLIVERIGPDGLRLGRACHFRLAGAYTYYLVQRGRRSATVWHMIVDTGGAAPDRKTIETDFQVLQFVLGRQLRVPTLIGVARDGGVVP